MARPGSSPQHEPAPPAEPAPRASGPWRVAAPAWGGVAGAREIAGGFGDIGVFVPLALGLIAVNGLGATAVFGMAGLYYVASGRYYRLPMPVQPFKAVSSISIAQGLSAGTIQAAALGMSAGLLLLSVGRLPAILERLFAPPVVRGIQVGLGIILLSSGVQLARRDPRLEGLSDVVVLGILLAGVLLVALLNRQTRVPALLIVGSLGIAWGALTVPADVPPLTLGPDFTMPGLPTLDEMATALVVLVLPQLPLTLGNSVVSTTDVAHRYFGARAARVRPRTLLRDMGLANLLAGLGGGIPMCHGAGGMTAHVRFGATTGIAVAAVGIAFIVLALVFGAAVPTVLALLPATVLGALVGYVGWQHLLLVRDLRRRADLAIAVLVGAATLVSGSLAAAFVLGLAAYWGGRAVGLPVSEPLVPGESTR